MRKNINNSISFFLIIINSKVVTKEVLDPTDLVEAQKLYIYKLINIIIVYKNKKLVFVIF